MLDRWLFFTFVSFWGTLSGSFADVDISLDSRDSGFFLRPYHSELNNKDDTLERFTVLHPMIPVTIKASYGPFSVKQTVVPSLLIPTNSLKNDTHVINGISPTETVPPLAFPSNSDLDISVSLVTQEIKHDRPVLRVLFHSSHTLEPKSRQHSTDNQKIALCAILYVHRGDEHVIAKCDPTDNRDGVCLAEAILPSHWWPPLESGLWKSIKQQKTTVRVEYTIIHSRSQDCIIKTLPTSSMSTTYLADVLLSTVHGSYEEVKSDDIIRILVPQGPVYPKSKVYVPVYLQPNPIYPLYVFIIRARVKSGLRILGAQVSQPLNWQISVDMNSKQTVATVTAYVKDTENVENIPSNAQEIFTWLFEVEEDANFHDNGRIIWLLRYVLDSRMAEQYDFDDDNMKMTSRLDIQKDDVEAVLPIAKSTQLLNTAVLTGRQVSQPMKVFVVSQAGKVGDVTLQSSCHSADESILKVSPSCTSVYLDGSEIRGSQNASVLVKYGTYTGQAHFLVWMPEIPLMVRLSDTKLSQVKGWRTPQLERKKSLAFMNSGGINSSNRANIGNRSNMGTITNRQEAEDLDVVCRLRYQQSHVDVYTRFVSVDHNSGREAYLLNRRGEVCITELVSPFLRVADMRIATLKSSIVQGQQSGRTEVQVLSPITGRVIGAREVRVGSDKETITHLQVTVVTGLNLSVTSDDSLPNVFTAVASVNNKLTSQYQEGLLDIKLHYSDGTFTSLADITDTDYHLSVDTFDSGVVAFAPMAGLHHPRVIAIGEGKGDLLHVSLELAERCQKRRSQPMAMAYVFIEVDFNSATHTTSVQNDARFKTTKGLVDKQGGNKSDRLPSGNMKDVDSILYKDSINPNGKYEPTIQARQDLVRGQPTPLTPLEIGMYALLGVFCLAIFVFLVSCSVFAVRYKRKQVPAADSGESVAHAHDWVWLGRATLERNSINTKCSQTLMPMADFNGNHPGDNSISKVQRRDKKNTTGRSRGSGCRASNISFPGSEISIRITTNPQELPEEKEDEMIEKGAVTTLTNHNALHLPSIVDVNANANLGCEKKVRIQTNPVPPPIAPDTYKKHSHNPVNSPPPIPPHRNILPPVPPHGRSHGNIPVDQKGSIKENGTRSGEQGSDMGWEAVAQGMNYDQLIEYFDNLKESSA